MLNRNCEVTLTNLDAEEQALLDETFDQFRQAAQHVADHGWSDNPANIGDNKDTLHDATYNDVREQTDLTANHVQAARSLAAEALDSCKELSFEEDQHISKPRLRGSVVVSDNRTVTFNDDHCTLSTTEDRTGPDRTGPDRVSAEYVFPGDTTDTPFETDWKNPDWEKNSATLHKRDETYFLHVNFQNEPDTDASTVENGTERNSSRRRFERRRLSGSHEYWHVLRHRGLFEPQARRVRAQAWNPPRNRHSLRPSHDSEHGCLVRQLV